MSADDIVAVAAWGANPEGHGQGAGDAAHEIAFTPERVLMQDFTGVPGRGRPGRHARRPGQPRGQRRPGQPPGPGRAGHRPLGHHRALGRCVGLRHATCRSSTSATWSATSCCAGPRAPSAASAPCRPGMGICHQVNLEYLSRLVFATEDGRAFCDTLVGTDSHTTMVNGLGVLGWGVGGIEAEAAMLGQPLSMLLPPVVGLRISGEPKPGITATDVVLTVTELLRDHGVVGAFVECYGPGVAALPARDPGHHRQHEPRVRGHMHHVPHRPGDHRLPALHRARRGAPGPGRGLRQGAGALARPRRARAGVLRARHARPGRRGALAGRAVPARRTGWRWPRPGSLPGGARPGAARAATEPGGGAPPPDAGRRRGDRRHHQLHQHLEPPGHGRRPACWPRGRWSGGCGPSPG